METTVPRRFRRWALTAPMWQVGLVAWFVGVPLVVIPLGILGALAYDVAHAFLH